MNPEILAEALDGLKISEPTEKLPLEEYFPDHLTVHEFNPSENKITKTTYLSDDVKNWLREKANYNFVFQCLLCRQEMTFNTAFNRGTHYLNRSHLLTKKHKNNVKGVVCIGILYVSSQKFIICREKDFISGNIFNVVKTVKRKDFYIDHNMIQNKVFCKSYTMFTLDRKTKMLSEMHLETDIVTFMRENVRPLFSLHCLICNIKASNYTVVVNHLLGRKHIKKLCGSKGAIIAIKDFNIFISCDVNKLSSFLFLDHLNSYLEEIIVASEGTIVISGCHTKDGKTEPKDGEISIKVDPIKLPNGEIKESVKITTRFHNFLSGPPEKDSISNELASCSTKGQKNVIIYEFSAKDFQEYYMDNILYASFCDGSRMWCSRCKKGIFTLQALQTHLSSVEHNNKIRGNEQVGFMCHFCRIFFIELKGEVFVHTHSSRDNKNIIQRLGEAKTGAIEYNTPLNSSVRKAYGRLFSEIAEASKFSCMACYDVTKQKLMYLSHHEISECHKNVTKKFLFTYCQYCNVIYIDKELDQISMQFKFHYASHLTESNTVINYRIYNTNGDSVETEVDNTYSSFKKISAIDEGIMCQKLTVRFSSCFIQFLYPGINAKEFAECEMWGSTEFSKYLEIYASITGRRVEHFQCLICNVKDVTKSEMLRHLFVFNHQSNQLFKKVHYFKICDICNTAMFSQNLNELQEHFFHSRHLEMFSKKRGIPSTFILSINQANLSWLKNISKSRIIEIINSRVSSMKLTFENNNKLFKDIKKDILSLLSTKFPNMSVTFYGSQVSGLATEQSDLDISLNLGNEYWDEVINIFASENQFFTLIVYISDTPVPIIRAIHNASGVTCDFNLENADLQADSSKIIKILTTVDERVVWLLAAVKYWAETSKLKSTNMFPSYALTWLVLFFLMQPDVRIIPNISYVIEKIGGLFNIRDKDVVLQWKARSDISKEKSKFDLLVSFFNYYSLMRFSEYKLFPISGLVIPKDFGVRDDESPMFMQDPLNEARNILSIATTEKSEKLTAACYLSLHMQWRFDE